jgi:uncharacterized membrane protein YbaN (DUF454 family)
VPLMIGVLLALAVGLFATRLGLDRDRALYPAVTIVVASFYVLFAVMGASTGVLLREILAGAAFLLLAAIGFKKSLWLVVAALAGHGVFDLSHGSFIDNAGMPAWWPHWCLAYDVTAAAYLAWLLKSKRLRATA